MFASVIDVGVIGGIVGSISDVTSLVVVVGGTISIFSNSSE